MKFAIPLITYVIVCIIAVLLPASEGYNTFTWKLFVSQIYAIPALLIAILITYFISKKVSAH